MMIMTPHKFSGMNINGQDGTIFSSSFTVPTHKVMSKITKAAGGYLMDLDYGENAQLVPQPFTVLFHFQSTTPTGLASVVNSLLGTPAMGGKLGVSAQFRAKELGTDDVYFCTAQLSTPGVTINGSFYGPSTIKLSRVPVTFTPSDDFALLVV